MSEFTPGPWTVVLRGERGTFHIPEAQKHEAQYAWMPEYQDGYNVSSANARLIAAAPDMYWALSKLVERIEFNGGIGPYEGGPAFVLGTARAALAKARG